MTRQGPPVWERALEAKGEITEIINRPGWDDFVHGWLLDRLTRYGLGSASPSAYAYGYARQHIQEAEPLFVTAEMQQLVDSAMDEFDPSEKVTVADFFLDAGLAVLEQPFEMIDMKDMVCSTRAMSWRVRRDQLVWTDGDTTPPQTPEEWEAADDRFKEIHDVVEIFLWSHVDDVDDYTREGEGKEAADHMREHGIRWTVLHATTVPLEQFSIPEEMRGEGDARASWAIFIRVLNRLMEERIVLKSRMHPHRAIRRMAAKRGVTDVNEVLVVELRRPVDRSLAWPEDGRGEPVHYSHRFMVRGHWRNQPYGPKGSPTHVKQKFIASYIKGDPNLPLVLKPRVWVWDR